MYRHPFANPEHLHGYSGYRAGSLDFHVDRRSPTPGPYDVFQSFVPMASQSTFFGDHMGLPPPSNAAAALDRARPASLPETRQRHSRYINDMNTTWSEGINDTRSEPTRTRDAWKRALQRMRRRARRGLQKVRELFSHRDDRRLVSGFS